VRAKQSYGFTFALSQDENCALFKEKSRQETKKEKIKMKILLIVGLLLVVLGVLSLVVPIPQTHTEGIKVGDAKLGVQTTHDEKVAPMISVVLIAGGIALSIAGARSK
jgi:hypothetical protein